MNSILPLSGSALGTGEAGSCLERRNLGGAVFRKVWFIVVAEDSTGLSYQKGRRAPKLLL